MKTKAQVEEDFDKEGMIVDACLFCDGIGKVGTFATSPWKICSECGGKGNKGERYELLKKFLSSIRRQDIDDVVGIISEMRVIPNLPPDWSNGRNSAISNIIAQLNTLKENI